jgi:hypothetical protein
MQKQHRSVWSNVPLYNVVRGTCDISELASHAFEEGHKVGCCNTTILHFDPNSVCRKYKRQHIPFILTILSVSVVRTYNLFDSI